MMGLTTMIGDVLSSKNSTGHLSRDPMAKKWRGSLPFHEVCPKERSNRSWNGSLLEELPEVRRPVFSSYRRYMILCSN